ncbi:hypothetical protein PR001_g5216 [Phytophthora rubi]|uniref:Uncharacterized protein n=1 Tax=Phytophthora rubi TaxID=129364 RepID=A0A6A3NH51_9STRA|nr:hypothetical protein PR002_g5669 [Phytophthora rubi]KAE9044817.1 hypothetical protein PR001_g5216 [Phytophthora rubi]
MSLLQLKTTVKPIDENKREQFVTYSICTRSQDTNDRVTLNTRPFDYGNGVERLSWRKHSEYTET